MTTTAAPLLVLLALQMHLPPRPAGALGARPALPDPTADDTRAAALPIAAPDRAVADGPDGAGAGATAGGAARPGGAGRSGAREPGTDAAQRPPPEPLPPEPLPGEPLPGEPLPGEPLPGEPLPIEPLPVERRLVALRGVRDLDGDRIGDLCARTVRAGSTSELIAISAATGEALWIAEAPEGFHERSPGPPIDAIVPIGDLDADGAGEIAVVWRRADRLGQAQQHLVALHAGHDGRVLRVMRLGREAEWAEGVCIAQTADLDGDVQPDLLVAAPARDLRPGELSAFSCATGEELWRVRTGAVRSENGASVVALRDANGDAIADVAVLERDGLAIVSGRDGRPIRRLGAEALGLAREGGATWALGTTLTMASDLDGDRIPEVALLVRERAGDAAELVLASPGKGEVVLRLPVPVRSAEVFAAGLRTLGDADGDGRPELLLCDPGWNLAGSPVCAGVDAGAVRVLSGQDGFLQRTWEGGACSLWLGAFATPAGDVDRDGVPDVWMSTTETCGRLGQAVWLASGSTGEAMRWVELARLRVEARR